MAPLIPGRRLIQQGIGLILTLRCLSGLQLIGVGLLRFTRLPGSRGLEIWIRAWRRSGIKYKEVREMSQPKIRHPIEGQPKTHKKFNGVIYAFLAKYPLTDKGRAEDRATGVRRYKGGKARVVRVYNYWCVYARSV